MAKNTTPAEEQQQASQPETSSPTQKNSIAEELLTNGKTTLRAKSREGLAEILNSIPADVHYGVGTVDYDRQTELYSLVIYTS